MQTNAKIYIGDATETLQSIPDNSVQTVVTSPPYWGLRDYGTGEWMGGDPDCSHMRDSKKSDKTITGHKNFDDMLGVGDAIYKDECKRCGATRRDSQLGLETTPQDFIEKLCQVFDAIWRVLKDDGTIWVNLGDSYAGSGKGSPGNFGKHAPSGSARHLEHNHSGIVPDGLKPKDLVGIPWRFAFAMQDRGWYLRQDIIWHKPNPMPESVTDRCTKSHEYIFLMSKKPKYYFDNEAIKEEASSEPVMRSRETYNPGFPKGARFSPGARLYGEDGMRNKRDVWSVNVKPYKEAHFATYPTELIEPCILAGSKEGDTVLDPFSGSGTTGEVSMKHGRNYIGLELNPEYAKLSEKRLHNAIGMFGDIEIIDRTLVR